MTLHTIRLAGFWQADNPDVPTSFTRKFGPPRSQTDESAWLVVRSPVDAIHLNGQIISFVAHPDFVEAELIDLPPRNTLTITTSIEPQAVIEMRSRS